VFTFTLSASGVMYLNAFSKELFALFSSLRQLRASFWWCWTLFPLSFKKSDISASVISCLVLLEFVLPACIGHICTPFTGLQFLMSIMMMPPLHCPRDML